MTYFLKHGNAFTVSTKDSMDLHEALPPGNYVIKKSMQGLFLEAIDGFENPSKIYGNTLKHASRILDTFSRRPSSTGVMLAGEKGSGKTLLAKVISNQAAQTGIPTIIINSPYCGDEFNSFLQMIEQPTIVMFDEFEKVYPKEHQEHILTLLDGVFPSKKLFILTCNDKWKIDANMRNRPGRVYYMMDFKGLGLDFIREYCLDNLNETKYADRICAISMLFYEFNFDMLKAIIEEMNRYNESPEAALELLNVKPENNSSHVSFIVSLSFEGKDLTKILNVSTWKGNPLINMVYVYYKINGKLGVEIDFNSPQVLLEEDEDDGEEKWKTVRFSPNDLNKIDVSKGIFHYKNVDGYIMTLTKPVEKVVSPYGVY